MIENPLCMGKTDDLAMCNRSHFGSSFTWGIQEKPTLVWWSRNFRLYTPRAGGNRKTGNGEQGEGSRREGPGSGKEGAASSDPVLGGREEGLKNRPPRPKEKHTEQRRKPKSNKTNKAEKKWSAKEMNEAQENTAPKKKVKIRRQTEKIMGKEGKPG